MSRAQGDAFKTWTDHKLNEYKCRLDAKLRRMIDHTKKWYKCGAGWILVEEMNRVSNPNGSWKWDGWIIEARELWITVFPEECVKVIDGKPIACGWSQAKAIIDDDKDLANSLFKTWAKPLARNLTNWLPPETNNDVYLDYEGRKPVATIVFLQSDADPRAVDFKYTFGLDLDGQVVMTGDSIEALKEEAIKLGADLQETHTP